MSARQKRRSHLAPIADGFSKLPYWFLVALLLAIVFLWVVTNDKDYRIIFDAVRKGLWTMIYVSFIALCWRSCWGFL